MTSQFDHDQHELALDWDTDTMVRLFDKTREFGLVASKSGAYRNVLRICPPLCMQMNDVSLFADAINKSFDSLLAVRSTSIQRAVKLLSTGPVRA